MTVYDDLTLELTKVSSLIATAKTRYEEDTASMGATIAGLQGQMAVLQTQLDECTQAGWESIPSGTDLIAAFADLADGARVQLQGSYTLEQTLTPKPGTYIKGPAKLVPGVKVPDIGINCKSKDAVNVVIEGLDVSSFGLRGLVPWYGARVKGGAYHHNGEMGIGFDGGGADQEAVVLDGIEAFNNGTTDFLGHGASGVKFYHVRRSEVRNSNIHNNLGCGLWWDFNSGDVLIEDNNIHDQGRKGVFYEKCGGSWEPAYDGFLTVRRNNIVRNGQELNGSVADAGVSIISSKNALVDENVFGESGVGIGIYVREDPNRLAPKNSTPGFPLSNITIGSGNVMNGDEIRGCDHAGVICA